MTVPIVPGIRVRPVTDADVPVIRSLLVQLGYDLAPEEVMRRLAAVRASPDHVVLAGESDGRMISLLHLYIRPALEKPPEVVVQALVVDATRRQGGIGKRMMAAAEAWARDRSLRSVALASHVVRDEAHAFYAALGYERVATSHLLRKVLG